MNHETFYSILEESGWISKVEDGYVWNKPGLVKYIKTGRYESLYPTILGYPYQIVDSILEFAIIAEEE